MRPILLALFIILLFCCYYYGAEARFSREDRESFYANATICYSHYAYWKRIADHLQTDSSGGTNNNDATRFDAQDKQVFFATAVQGYMSLHDAEDSEDPLFYETASARFDACVRRHMAHQLFAGNPCSQIALKPPPPPVATNETAPVVATNTTATNENATATTKTAA